MESLTYSQLLNLGLIVTVIGMGIVFSVLIFLSIVLWVMAKIVARKKEEKPAEVKEVASAPAAPAAQNTGELIAVISAAVAASMAGKSQLVVRSIVRSGDATPLWGRMGRQDQMASRTIG